VPIELRIRAILTYVGLSLAILLVEWIIAQSALQFSQKPGVEINKHYLPRIRKHLVVYRGYMLITYYPIDSDQNYLREAEKESSSFYVFAVLALSTGARVGELIALQNYDVDLTNRRIHLCKLKEYRGDEICKRTKGGGDRWLGMNDEPHQVLRATDSRRIFAELTTSSFITRTADRWTRIQFDEFTGGCARKEVYENFVSTTYAIPLPVTT